MPHRKWLYHQWTSKPAIEPNQTIELESKLYKRTSTARTLHSGNNGTEICIWTIYQLFMYALKVPIIWHGHNLFIINVLLRRCTRIEEWGMRDTGDQRQKPSHILFSAVEKHIGNCIISQYTCTGIEGREQRRQAGHERHNKTRKQKHNRYGTDYPNILYCFSMSEQKRRK